MDKSRSNLLAIALLACVVVCSEAKMADSSGGPAAESAVLKQEMIDATMEVMQARRPDADPDALRGRVEQLVEAGIDRIRKYHPQFLVVSPETEKRLQSGTTVPDAASRIADAEQALKQSGMVIPELIKIMLPEHEHGTLSPRRTELLAQLMVSAVKEHEMSLRK